jgi:TonB family protein
MRNGKEIMTAHLESIEALNSVNNADFSPSADASVAPIRVSVSSRLANEFRITQAYPTYPTDAKSARVQGTVVLHILIGAEGNVLDLRAISGPPMLIPAAIAAAKQWTYLPYTLNGERQEMETTANLVFNLGG